MTTHWVCTRIVPRMNEESRVREKQIHLWLSEEENDALTSLACSWGVSKSDTLRIMLRRATEGSWTEVPGLKLEKGKRAKR